MHHTISAQVCLEGQGMEYSFDNDNSDILNLRNSEQPLSSTDQALKVCFFHFKEMITHFYETGK